MTNPNSLIGLRADFEDFRKAIMTDLSKTLFDIAERLKSVETRLDTLEAWVDRVERRGFGP